MSWTVFQKIYGSLRWNIWASLDILSGSYSSEKKQIIALLLKNLIRHIKTFKLDDIAIGVS